MDNVMADQPDKKTTQILYSIRVAGELTEEWSTWFEGMTVLHEVDGETLIIGQIEDQAVLYGLLKKIRNLGIPLISVNRRVLIKKNNLFSQGEENEK
jgi:hypothetical protein